MQLVNCKILQNIRIGSEYPKILEPIVSYGYHTKARKTSQIILNDKLFKTAIQQCCSKKLIYFSYI